jgi:hypothetical protein
MLGGGGVAHSKVQGGGGDLGQNQAAGALFCACHHKPWLDAIQGGYWGAVDGVQCVVGVPV